jgi:nucleoid-associated protein YgaU
MKFVNRQVTTIIAAAFVVLVLGCGDPVPVKEMAEAHFEINRAAAVKAEQFAPAQLKEATALLMKSHDGCKAEKYEDALKDAEAALKKAKEAYAISIPLLTKEALDAADKAVLAADEVYASELANADYENAVSKQKAAHSQYDEKNFAEAYPNALEAEKSANNAKQLALAKKDTLKDAIAEVKETIARAEKFGAGKSAPEKIKTAKDKSAEAQTAYEAQKLKDGFAAVAVAKTNADEAYLEAVKTAAAANIVKAETAIADAEKHPNAKAASDEINGAKEMLKTSRSQYDGGQYNESIQSSDEAARLAGIALATSSKTPAEKDVAVKDTTKDQTPGETVSEEYDIYTVQYFKDKAKDCLWFIAGKFYKNPKKWPTIYKANTDQIKNPDLIRPGWKLKVPKLNK